MTDTIAVERHGAVARIMLNRPERLNALTAEMLVALRAAIEEAPMSGARAILLCGSGRGFCAGADLLAGGGGDPGAKLARYYNPVVEAIAAAPIPVVAAVQRVAAGGGVGLALAADIVVMERNARFTFPFLGLGLVPDVGVSWALARAMGKARALDHFLTGEDLQAHDAFAAGVVSRLAEEGEVLNDAAQLADRLAAMPTIALGLVRSQVQSALTSTLGDLLALEAANQTIAGSTADYREAIAAFRDRRQPRFGGR